MDFDEFTTLVLGAQCWWLGRPRWFANLSQFWDHIKSHSSFLIRYLYKIIHLTCSFTCVRSHNSRTLEPTHSLAAPQAETQRQLARPLASNPMLAQLRGHLPASAQLPHLNSSAGFSALHRAHCVPRGVASIAKSCGIIWTERMQRIYSQLKLAGKVESPHGPS